jgi:hypothetical protein
MTKNTRTALAAILAADRTITKADADAALAVLEGKAEAIATPGASKWLDPFRTIGKKDACRLLAANEEELDALFSAQLLSPCFNEESDIIGYTAESVRFILENRGKKVKPDLPPLRSAHDELALAELDGRIDVNGYPVDELELSIRAINCLHLAGIGTIGDLRRRSEKDLLAIRGFGKKCIEEVKDRLAECGLELATANAKESCNV